MGLIFLKYVRTKSRKTIKWAPKPYFVICLAFSFVCFFEFCCSLFVISLSFTLLCVVQFVPWLCLLYFSECVLVSFEFQALCLFCPFWFYCVLYFTFPFNWFLSSFVFERARVSPWIFWILFGGAAMVRRRRLQLNSLQRPRLFDANLIMSEPSRAQTLAYLMDKYKRKHRRSDQNHKQMQSGIHSHTYAGVLQFHNPSRFRSQIKNKYPIISSNPWGKVGEIAARSWQ